jgi:hypothetical protein
MTLARDIAEAMRDACTEINRLRRTNAELIEALHAADNRLYCMTPADMSPADADRRDGALFLIQVALAEASKAKGVKP